MVIAYTPQLFVFDSITKLTIIVVCALVYLRTRQLYQLSLQRGIRYFSIAMFFYVLNISFAYTTNIFNFLIDRTYGTFETSPAGIIVNILTLFAATMGGFFLAYCLVWRKFEKDWTKGRRIAGFIGLSLAASLIIATDMYLVFMHGLMVPLLFFGILIIVLSYAIFVSYMECKQLRKSPHLNPFLSLVGISIGVYVALLIESLVAPFLFTVHYYIGGIVTVFALAFLYQVTRITK